MELETKTVGQLIATLQTLPSGIPVYLESHDGNSIPWNGVASLFPHKFTDARTDSEGPVCKLTVGF